LQRYHSDCQPQLLKQTVPRKRRNRLNFQQVIKRANLYSVVRRVAGQRFLPNYPWWTSFWLLTLLPSEALRDRKTPLERMVRSPKRRRAG
jgi:hypothetical protein